MLHDLAARYETFKEETLYDRFFTAGDLAALLGREPFSPLKTVYGYSAENRPVHLLRIGAGPVHVLMWSQMHGDEPTATAALFDLLNWLRAEETGGKDILQKCTIHMLPMLNPDGTQSFDRRNAQKIDINRDFRSAISPEAQLLKKLHSEIKPDFCFNLHDMESLWSAGNSTEPTCMAFLAPPYNRKREVNWTREQAMRVIGCIHDDLQEFIPGRIARWGDQFEERAFGDNFQKSGSPTILIESGSWRGDPEKQQVRKYTFLSIVSALHAIATGKYQQKELLSYAMIPENSRNLYHLIIRSAGAIVNGHRITADFGINFLETYDREKKQGEKRWFLSEIGDLSGFGAYEEINGEGLAVELGSGPDEPVNLIMLRHGHFIGSFESGRRRNRDAK
ncbi:MAG: carboxypeptidase [Mucilaginibacter polytrichastri]|nr:carboxypeptidase [Mucilaginibacter polytrichastri]